MYVNTGRKITEKADERNDAEQKNAYRYFFFLLFFSNSSYLNNNNDTKSIVNIFRNHWILEIFE